MHGHGTRSFTNSTISVQGQLLVVQLVKAMQDYLASAHRNGLLTRCSNAVSDIRGTKPYQTFFLLFTPAPFRPPCSEAPLYSTSDPQAMEHRDDHDDRDHKDLQDHQNPKP